MNLVPAFRRLDATQRVVSVLRTGSHRAAGGLWGSSAALLIASLWNELDRPLLIVTADDDDSEALNADLSTFGVGFGQMLVRQDIDVDGQPEPLSQGSRARCLARLDEDPDDAFLICASLESLLQPAPAVEALRTGRRTLRSGDRLDQQALFETCVDAGLRRVPVVLAPGEVSLRGDVLDVFPLVSTEAVRIECFDDEIESIRTFDPASQRSLDLRDEVSLIIGGSTRGGPQKTHVLTHLVRRAMLVVWYEPLRIDERRQALAGFDRTRQSELVALQETLTPQAWLEVSSLPSQDLDFKVQSAGSAVGSGESDPLGRLRAIRGIRPSDVHIVCPTAGESERLREIFAHKDADLEQERVHLEVGTLARGFRIPELGAVVLSNSEFAGVPQRARIVERPIVPSRALQSFFELGPGDLVVHAVHGIAMFEGIERIERGEGIEDHLRLTFRDDVKLLVPVSKIHLVQKYVGSGESGTAHKLDRLGGKGFQRRKEEVHRSLFDLAADLLEVQAQRDRIERPPYPTDPLEAEFLDGFPFEDTDDQRTGWAEIKADLEKPQPMDRLLCGDVGFGKTELALRAAFKVAITGRQVAVLVPTTVLAEQHWHTFTARFEPHGLSVGVLSRFRLGKRRKDVLEGLQTGRVDVLVGTHRILSKDVTFSDLGLVIVDEEQRFGVRQKEHLKRLRTAVDVLSLSATPIPRTLHASLLGIRQISTLNVPPRGRQDVETRVVFREERLVQEALQRELQRGGQTFVLHNRIAGLEPLEALVSRLVPDAKVAIGHGQMTEAQMEKTLRGFVRGEFDVLICTTIVENGLDLPRANTILIDHAEHFGLAELHQLRGRVGRSSVKAHCYLMMDRAHPPGPDGRRRLKALEEFSQLGAGFAIAMKDLEIRGAGNILGPQQSGHIAAVGYDMYCRLLRGAVEQARGAAPAPLDLREVDVDLQIRAFLPDTFVPDAKARLDVLRDMDRATDPESARAIRKDLLDRFGKLPAPVDNLLRVFLLKHLLTAVDVTAVQRTEADRLVVRHPPGRPLGGAWLDGFAEIRAVEAGKTHLMLPPRRGRKRAAFTGEEVLQLLLESLCEIGSWSIMEPCRTGSRRPRRRRSPSSSS